TSYLLSSPFHHSVSATSECSTLSLHDALPIFIDRLDRSGRRMSAHVAAAEPGLGRGHEPRGNFIDQIWNILAGMSLLPLDVPNLDRKSTRLNSSHQIISYAVFCLKKKKSYTNS